MKRRDHEQADPRSAGTTHHERQSAGTGIADARHATRARGLRTPPNRSTHQAKHTAEAVCALRAVGALEPDPAVRGGDHLALHFLGTRYRILARSGPTLRKLILAVLERRIPGVYGFLIARTNHVDQLLRDALDQGIGQLVVLGAGYDSRAQRFMRELDGVRVFEVDLPGTGARKRQMLDREFGTVVGNVAYVDVDFNTDDLGERLGAHGYKPEIQTFFIWEGVSYFLRPDSVRDTLAFIRHNAPEGSGVVFDYIYKGGVDGEASYYGAAANAAYATKHGEPYIFGLEEGEIREFLGSIGLELLEAIDANTMEARYLRRRDGRTHRRVAGHFCIAHAVVRRDGSTGSA